MTSLIDLFEFAAGSVTGRDHVLAAKNNQDAWAVRQSGDALVAVVCDGCGSVKHSEVGAHITAHIVTSALMSYATTQEQLTRPAYWTDLRLDIVDSLADVQSTLDLCTEAFLADYALCTVVGAIITPHTTALFHIGDGVMFINDEHVPIAPYKNNAPPYLAYALSPTHAEGWGDSLLDFRVPVLMPTPAVNSILLATDGAEAILKGDDAPDITEFTTDSYFKNKDLLRRRLYLRTQAKDRVDWERRCVERTHPTLTDDTTIVAIRRRPET